MAKFDKEKYLNTYAYILSECKRQWEDNQEEVYGSWDSQSDDTKAEYYNELYEMYKENLEVDGKALLTLTKFLNYFNFDYCLYDNGKGLQIGLIDEQGADLGGIEEERYQNNKHGVNSILDRLDNYYKDYIFDDLAEKLEEEYGIDTSDMSWNKLYDKVQELNLDYEMDIMPYIFGDKEIILDSENKKIIKE